MRQGQFQAPTQNATASTKNIEEMFAAIMGKTTVYDQKFANMEAALSELKMQVGQLASTMNQREPGRFPSQAEVNPQQHEELKAITTLRSGRMIDNQVVQLKAPMSDDVSDKEEHDDDVVQDDAEDMKRQEAELMKPIDLTKYKEPALFPHLVVKKTTKSKNDDLLEVFRKVQINIPLLSAISHIPAYARFLKDLCTKKRKFKANEQEVLSVEVTSLFHRPLPPKLDDPGCFTVPCTIGDRRFECALMDLGSSINVMPYATYKALKIGNLKDTCMSVQLADKSIVYPTGVVEDVLVKVHEFLVPADFVIMDTEEKATDRREVSIILGRPFLTTAGAKVDVKAGILSLKVLGDTVEFEIIHIKKHPPDIKRSVDIQELDLTLGDPPDH